VVYVIFYLLHSGVNNSQLIFLNPISEIMKKCIAATPDFVKSFSQHDLFAAYDLKKNFLPVIFSFLFFLSFHISLHAQVMVTATIGTMGPTNYSTLKGAFDAINVGTHKGVINITILGNTTETAPAVLNGSIGLSSYTSIIIQPAGGAARTISGAIAAGSPLVDLNGADNVTIDGLNTGGDSLIISNTTVSAISGTCTIRFQTDATNNLITRCRVLGSATMANGTNGGNIWFGSAAVSIGNDDNTISYCDIGPAGGNLPSKCIYFSGTSNVDPGVSNSGIVITHNNIYDFFNPIVNSSGIDLNSGSVGTTISYNRFYQTAPRVQIGISSLVHRPVSINNSSGGNFQVIGNIIGFANSAGTGMYTFEFPTTTSNSFSPIFCAALTSSIQENTIAGIAIAGAMSGTLGSAPFKAIHTSGGSPSIGDMSGNLIGSQAVTGSITYTSSATAICEFIGIYLGGTAFVSNNVLGGIIVSNSSTGATNFYGIRPNSTGTWTCTNNTVGGTVANSIQSTCTASGALVNGINNASSSGTVSGNTVRNMTTAGGTNSTSLASLCGIVHSSATISAIITQNTIYQLTTNGAGSQLNGIIVSGGSPTIITGNTIHSLSGTGTGTTSLHAIFVSSGNNLSLLNNKIYNLAETGTATSSALMTALNIVGGSLATIANNIIGDLRAPLWNVVDGIRGIYLNSSTISTTFRVFYNTVYLNATSSGLNFGSVGIYHSTNSTPTIGLLDLRNNIIVNTSTANGTGATVAYKRSNSILLNYANTSNNNLFYAGSGSSNFIFYDGSGKNLSAFKTLVSPREAASVTETVSSTPGVFFQTLNGADAYFLHLVPGLMTQAESGGANVTSPIEDFDANVRHGNSGYSGSGIAPDIGADEFTGIHVDLTGPAIFYSTILNTLCLNALSVSATISDLNNVNVASGTKPRIWFKKSTNLNTLPATNDNTTDGWKYAEALNNTSPFIFSINYNLISGGIAAGNTIQYFIVAQDMNTTPNISVNTGIFTSTPPTVALNAGAFPVTVTNSYKINLPLSTSITVGTGGTYPTLTGGGGLFEALNAAGLNGNTVVTILSTTLTENGAALLKPIAYPCDTFYTLTIKPAAGISTLLTGAISTSLLDLDGADHVIFEGSNNGTSSKNMTLRNTGGGAAFRMMNGATHDTLRNVIAESSNNSALSGTVWFGPSVNESGNCFNMIKDCMIRDRTDMTALALNGVVSNGSPSAPNEYNTISGCHIFNWTTQGVLVVTNEAGIGWTISNSKFYQTANRTTSLIPIFISGGSGYSILNNSIGGSAADRSGNPMKTTGISTIMSLTMATIATSSIQGNLISNLEIGLTFKGISVLSGNVDIGTVTGNILGGGANPYDTIRTGGISSLIEYTGLDTANIANNVVGNVANYTGANQGMYGINASEGLINIKNNVIRDFKSTSTELLTSNSPTGILLSSSIPGAIIDGNQVYNISNINAGTGAYTVLGISLSGALNIDEAAIVKNNKVYNLTATGPGSGNSVPVIYGIRSLSCSATIFNNMVSLGANNTNRILGIEVVSAKPNNIYFNTVSITGTVSAGAINSTAFVRSASGLVDIRNNIFSNSRTGGTGFHAAIGNHWPAITGWLPGASDRNVLYSSNPATVGQWLGTASGSNRSIATWQNAQNGSPTGSGGDLNSIYVLPVFTSATDLHLTTDNTSIDNAGLPVDNIHVDFDGEAHNFITPDLGADEFTTGCSTVVMNTNENGAGSLRDIISCAPAGATITFDNILTGQTILVGSSQITLDKSLNISGLGINNLILSGNDDYRIFHVETGKTVKIEKMSLIDGNSVPSGGAILNEGNLTLKDVRFQNNIGNGVPNAIVNASGAAITIQGSVEVKN